MKIIQAYQEWGVWNHLVELTETKSIVITSGYQMDLDQLLESVQGTDLATIIEQEITQGG